MPGQIGLEKSPLEYVDKLIAVFQELRRALRNDGTMWANLGDTYTGYGGQKYACRRLTADRAPDSRTPPWQKYALKPKELIGLPWRIALSLQAGGWWLRSEIIWHKPNPLPESVTDRPTKAHEHLFLLAKNRRYYYDAAAIRVPCRDSSFTRLAQNVADQTGSKRIHAGKRAKPMKAVAGHSQDAATGRPLVNRRTVWTIPVKPFRGAHFATFPPALVEPCILAGCPVNGIVLDPFAGSGTTLEVAERLGRRWLGFELNSAYVRLAEARVAAFKTGRN